jgi:hypothetical protein
LPHDSFQPLLQNTPHRSFISQEESSDTHNTDRPNTPEPFTVIFDSVTSSDSTESTEEESSTPSSSPPEDAPGTYNLTTITSWERLQEWLRSQSDTLLFSDPPIAVGGDSKDPEDPEDPEDEEEEENKEEENS